VCEVDFQRARQLQWSFSSLLVDVIWSRTFESLFRAHDDELASARTLEKRHGTATGSVTRFPTFAAVPGSSAIVVRRWISPASRYDLASLAVQIVIHYPWRWPIASFVSCRMSTCGVSQERGAEVKRLFRQASSECNLICCMKVVLGYTTASGFRPISIWPITSKKRYGMVTQVRGRSQST
jgi:hypothetical protein